MPNGVLVTFFNKAIVCAAISVLANPCAAQLQIETPWVALAPPAATVNAAYMKLYNPQMQPQKIVNVNSDCCAMTMLHQMRREGDKMHMEHVDYLLVPAQSEVNLAPGGLHIMLMKPKKELQLYSKVTIVFTFADASEQNIVLDVKKYEP